MIEHRLIERMVGLLCRELSRIGSGKPDVKFLSDAVDFFTTYADIAHHGKEEQILFSELGKKKLIDIHRHMLAELLNEHVIARRCIASLDEATKQYATGDLSSLEKIREALQLLSTLYPAHIEKEDNHFFIPALEYFSENEQDSMLKRFLEFDENASQEKYATMVEQYEKRK